MLILLPPSEGKTPPTAGPPLNLDELSLPKLNPTRAKLLSSVMQLANGRPNRARQVLGLSINQLAEVERDRDLDIAPTASAAEVYSGVLFEALGYRTLTAAARRRLDRWVLISSGLWGVVRLTDQIPAYRLSSDVTLPRVGSVAKAWHRPLRAVMPEAVGDGVVLDLRSAGYARMWAPTDAVSERTLVGRIMQRRPDGSLQIVSHHNKASKGRLTRALAQQGKTPRTCDALASLIGSLGFDVQVVSSTSGKPNRLDIVMDGL